MPSVIDLFHAFQTPFLKYHHIKFFPRLQYIDQMMGHSLHFLRADLGGSDIHMFIYLHGIG